jgi:hypothetical protein
MFSLLCCDHGPKFGLFPKPTWPGLSFARPSHGPKQPCWPTYSGRASLFGAGSPLRRRAAGYHSPRVEPIVCAKAPERPRAVDPCVVLSELNSSPNRLWFVTTRGFIHFCKILMKSSVRVPNQDKIGKESTLRTPDTAPYVNLPLTSILSTKTKPPPWP